MNRTFLALVVLSLGATLYVPAFAGSDPPHKPHDAYKSRAPSGGVPPNGGTGSNVMSEGTQAGAPGNIVTAAQTAVFRTHDMDGDRSISETEAANDPGLKEAFAKLDVNSNGALTADEFDKYEPKVSAVTGAAPTKPTEPEPKP